jgi:hypothetical protein
MKSTFLTLALVFSSLYGFSQSVFRLDANGLGLPQFVANPTCAVADKGKLIYNTTQEKVLYCNGTTWIDPATGGTSSDWVSNVGNTYLSNLNGKVGIGTNAPLYPIDIVNANAELRVKSTSGNSVINIDAAADDAILRFHNNGPRWELKSYSTADFAIVQTGGVRRLFIESTNGNVGIGTGAPSQKLDVVGNTNIDGNLTVNAGKGIVRSDDATQMIIEDLTTPSTLNFTLASNGFTGPFTYNFANTYSAPPAIAFGSTSGITNPQNIIFSIQAISTTQVTIWVKNIGTTTSVASNASIKAMVVGKK